MSVPSAHIGVTSTYGVTLPANSEAQDASRTSTVELSELIGATGEIVKLNPLHVLKKDVSVNYVGASSLASVTVAQGLDPATIKVTKADIKEINKGHVACALTASGHEAFTDAAGSSVGAGEEEPDVDTLNLKTVTFALAENVDRNSEVKDVVVIGGNGQPAWRGTVTKKNGFSVKFKGDIPAGVVLGTAGAGVYGFTGGKLVVTKLMESQKKDEVNDGSYDGTHAPVAA